MTFLDYLWNDLASNLASYFGQQRWYGGKGRPLQEVRLADVAWLRSPPNGLALAIVACNYADGLPEFYLMPLGFVLGDRPVHVPPEAIIMPKLQTLAGPAVVYDALAEPAACTFLLDLMKLKVPLPAQIGQIVVQATPIFPNVRGPSSQPLVVNNNSVDQSNRCIRYDQQGKGRVILKLFSKLEAGINPDYEIALFLSEHTTFANMAPLAGAISYVAYGTETTLALVQGFEPNSGSAWNLAQANLGQLFERAKSTKGELTDEELLEQVSQLAGWANRLGQRTGELHVALASNQQLPEFKPEPLTYHDVAMLAASLTQKTDAVRAEWENLKALEIFRGKLADVTKTLDLGQKIRCHGDYHLGQVVCKEDDFIIIDFEGEPIRCLADRRAKQSPLKDVAGMVRSFDYAASVFLRGISGEGLRQKMEPWARTWQDAVTGGFLEGYLAEASQAKFLPGDTAAYDALLWLFTLEKALYELHYESLHRPDWMDIPRQSIKLMLGG